MKKCTNPNCSQCNPKPSTGERIARAVVKTAIKHAIVGVATAGLGNAFLAASDAAEAAEFIGDVFDAAT